MQLPSMFGRNKTSPERLMAVLQAPATFNRAARREAGVYGRAWAWDRQALGLPANLPPRYVRRKYTDTILTHPTTRRQRKARARILRAMSPSSHRPKGAHA